MKIEGYINNWFIIFTGKKAVLLFFMELHYLLSAKIRTLYFKNHFLVYLCLGQWAYF